MKTTSLLSIIQSPASGNSAEYFIGALIALMILIYLLVSLIKPERF